MTSLNPPSQQKVTLHWPKNRALPNRYSPQQYERNMRHGDGNSMQIILKVTEVCNIACTYCYFFFGGDTSYEDNPAHISFETMDALARFLENGVREYGIKRITLILHGGEPLMLKHDPMSRLLTAVRRATQSAELYVTVQTNAMLIDDRWIDLFVEHDVYVGVSLDGPPELNDVARLDKSGKGTYERTLRGVRKLFDAHAAGRLQAPGLLCVLSADFPADQLYRHFVHELGFRNIDFLLPIQNHDTFDHSQAGKLAVSMRLLFQLYRAETHAGINIRFFNKVLHALTMPPFFYSSMYRYSAQKDIVFVVSSSGEIGPDDNLRTSDPRLMSLGLNLADSELRDVVLDTQLAWLQDETFAIPTACLPCEFAQTCRGGDLFTRYRGETGFDNPSIHCETYKAIYTDALEMLMATGKDADLLAARLQAGAAVDFGS
ncbi:radical SAM protein [Duganella sp. S19_KUP01_CR8]|uniref:radical SAM protein n=1 Tax=Duganella sp. S19_KUP01_CR8 TaxID=3025502 RepID=UPI002FCDDA9E